VITNNLSRFYVVLFLERGPIYFSFDVYKRSIGEIISDLNFSTKADQILPQEMIQGKLNVLVK